MGIICSIDEFKEDIYDLKEKETRLIIARDEAIIQRTYELTIDDKKFLVSTHDNSVVILRTL